MPPVFGTAAHMFLQLPRYDWRERLTEVIHSTNNFRISESMKGIDRMQWLRAIY